MRSDGLLMRYLSNLQRLDESGSEKVRCTDRNRGFRMISRKKLVRIGILPLALAFVRPGYSYKGPAPRAPRFQLYRWLSGRQRRGHSLRPQTGPPMHVTSRRGFEI